MKKTAGGHIQDPLKKSRYNKGQLEAFFGSGTRETAPGKQIEQSTRTKKAVELEEGYNKKARLEDEYSEESKEREKGFTVNLEAMDTPLRGKRSSRGTTTKKGAQDSQDSQQPCLNGKEEREESYVRGSSISPHTT